MDQGGNMPRWYGSGSQNLLAAGHTPGDVRFAFHPPGFARSLFFRAPIKGRRYAPHARPVLAALGCGLRVSLDVMQARRPARAHVGALRMIDRTYNLP